MESAPIQAGDLDYAIQYESFFFFLFVAMFYLSSVFLRPLISS